MLESRKEALHKFKLGLQPFVVVVGQSNNIEQCFVIVDDVQWLATSPFHALDICFKVFFALDGKYPAEARHIWLFIQRCLYKLETPQDYINDKPLRTFLACNFAAFANFFNNNTLSGEN